MIARLLLPAALLFGACAGDGAAPGGKSDAVPRDQDAHARADHDGADHAHAEHDPPDHAAEDHVHADDDRDGYAYGAHEVGAHGGEAHTRGEPSASAIEFVPFARVSPEGLHLVNRPVELAPWAPTLRIPGTVRVDPDLQAQVSMPSVVRVVRLDAPPHATVRAGDRLAVLELVDPEVRQLQVHAVESRAELLAATTERDRTATYLAALGESSPPEERTAVRAELDVLEARVTSARSTLDAVLAALELAGLSEAQVSALERDGTVTTQVEVRAPRLPGSPDLEVAARPVRIGETVAAGAPLFELVALAPLQVVGEAFEADLSGVRRATREGLPVTVQFAGGEASVEGLTILAVEGTLDDARERITHFFVRLPNAVVHTNVVDGARFVDWQHRAGSRVELLVATEPPRERLVIPAEALVYDAGATWVFLGAEGGWNRVSVRPETVDARFAVLPEACPLKPGDELVVEGALALDLARARSLGGASSPGASGHAGHNH